MNDPAPVRSDLAPANLIALLRHRAQQKPSRRLYTFLLHGEIEQATLNYADLDRRARAIGRYLQEHRASRERVLLLFPPGLDYIAAFWGCLYAGAVAVPALPPQANRPSARLKAIAADSQASLVLTTETLSGRAQSQPNLHPTLSRLTWLTIEHLPLDEAERWQEPSVNGETPAFLQYTSGSTATPKGVIVSHANLLHNTRLIQRAFRFNEDSVVVGWLPLYHDMGLIGNMLQPLFARAECVLMSPADFLQRPARWLEAITRYRATISGGPNFAYDLCVQRVAAEQRATLDLSTWQVAFNGAEPIRAETIKSFSTVFNCSGFHEQAFLPCYGLAEATLYVSGAERGPNLVTVDKAELLNNRVRLRADSDKDGQVLAGSGRPAQEQQVIIVDPENLVECADRQIGEIWVSGQSVARGYWNRAAETRETFQAYTRGQAQGPFLRTGDLGFLHDGELFVTGRLKDLIIIRGRNHYPQDIEFSVVRVHSSLRQNCGAAFAAEVAGAERLVIAQEVDRRYKHHDLNGLITAIRQAVALEHEAQPYAVLLLAPGSIPKTSSGKIIRHECRARFLAGTLNIVAEWQADPATANEAGDSSSTGPLTSVEEIVAWLSQQLAAKLSLVADEIDVDRPLAGYGLDSLAVIELVHALEVELGVNLNFADLMVSSSLRDLASRALSATADTSQVPRSAEAETEPRSDYPLSSNQQALYFLYRLAPDSCAYHVPIALRIEGRLNRAALLQAIHLLAERHSALRTIFAVRDGDIRQSIQPAVRIELKERQVDQISTEAINELLGLEAERPFDLERRIPWRAILFARSDSEYLLLFVIHHIVCDGWSAAVLVREMEQLYQSCLEGGSNPLPPLPATYADFVRQQQLLQDERSNRQLEYWQRQLAGAPAIIIPADFPRPERHGFCGSRRGFVLTAHLTEQLKALSRSEGMTLFTTLLTAFLVMLRRVAERDDIIVGTDAANRQRADFQGLVGHFVNQLVLRADLSGNPTFQELLARVRQTMLAAYAHQDLPFQQLARLLQPGLGWQQNPLFQVMFTFRNAPLRTLHAMDTTWTPLEVATRSAKFDLTLALTDAGSTIEGFLEYNTDLFAPATIGGLQRDYETVLNIVMQRPSTHLDTLIARIMEKSNEQSQAELKRRQAANLERFNTIKPRAANLSRREIAHRGYLRPDQKLPLVITFINDGGCPIDWADWARSNTAQIESQLLTHGAILFRGFNCNSALAFERFAATVCQELYDENGEHTRRSVNGKVYTPVFYPPDQQLLWHNENTFNHRWPTRIFFGCLQPARQGGETTLVDSRRVFELLDVGIKSAFLQKQVTYLRNYGHGLGRNWQEVFRTNEKAEVEARCRENRMHLEWKDGDRLRTHCVRPAAIKHPLTGEPVWFNQAQHWHPACLTQPARASLATLFAEEDRPRNCLYGDGSRIDDATMQAICDLYRRLEIAVEWQPGDVLLLDNLLTAHGRNPFVGERHQLVAMGAMMSYEDVEPVTE